jgi:hypothetical protein
VKKFFVKYRKSRNLDALCQEAMANNMNSSSHTNNAHKSNNNTDNKIENSIEVMEVVILNYFYGKKKSIN